jgi:3-deoxy-D-manno-octulosonic-acid transferase
LFVQDEDSIHWLKTIGKHPHAWIGGDTRFDRVLAIRENFRNIPVMQAFTHQAPVLVAGSIWPSDLKLIHAFTIAFPNYKCILVPHEVDEHSINQCLNLFPDAVLYSDWIKDTHQHADAMIMVVDQIGLLADLYSIASLCYVGGGFNRSGIHNTLEAAVWGKPVFFGPNYFKFREAVALIECGGGFSVSDANSWIDSFRKIELQSGEWQRAGKCSEEMVRKHAGATQRIMHQIAEKRLLTN